MYGAAVRTPLVRVELPDGPDLYLKLEMLQPIASFKIRGAYNVVRQLSRDELKDGVWTVSAGNAAQGVAYAARKVGAACSVMVMDTAPQTKVDAIARLGATIVRAHVRRMRGKRSRRMPPTRCAATSSTRSTTIGSSPATARPAWKYSRIFLTSTRSSRRSAAAAALRHRRGGGCAGSPRRASTPPNRKRRRRSPRRWPRGVRVYFENWKASFVDGAGGKSVLASMWPLLSQLAGSIVVTLDEVAGAMKLAAERKRIIAEGAAGCAIAAALAGRTPFHARPRAAP